MNLDPTRAERRVMRVVTRLNIGGPAIQALLLTRALAPQYRTKLLIGRAETAEGELRDEAVTPQRIPQLVRKVAPLSDIRALRTIRTVIQDWRPHVIHSHMAKAGSLARAAAITTKNRPRLIHTFHGHVLEGYFSPKMQDIFIRTERALARRTDILVAVSDEVKDSLLKLNIGSENQYRVIPLGFDLRRFLGPPEEPGRFRSSLGLSEDIPLIAVVGRLVPIKDHPTLFRAMSLVPEVHLAVVGDGESRATLEKLADRLGIGRRVHFTGWRADVWNVYADVAATVLSSRNEGSPVALIEAHAAARPVVATDVGGVRSVVQDGKTGYLVPSAQPEEFAAAIERLLMDPSRAAEMGAAGRRRVRERFSQERLVADIRTLYSEVLERPV